MRLIDADALKEEVNKKKVVGRFNTLLLIDNAQTIIWCSQTPEGLPFMDLRERPKGEWVVYGKQGGIPITDVCSNCQYEMKWYKNKYNFCPHCGADMRDDCK